MARTMYWVRIRGKQYKDVYLFGERVQAEKEASYYSDQVLWPGSKAEVVEVEVPE